MDKDIAARIDKIETMIRALAAEKDAEITENDVTIAELVEILEGGLDRHVSHRSSPFHQLAHTILAKAKQGSGL